MVDVIKVASMKRNCLQPRLPQIRHRNDGLGTEEFTNEELRSPISTTSPAAPYHENPLASEGDHQAQNQYANFDCEFWSVHCNT